MWQVLNSIFKDTRKTHVCPEYNKSYKIVATIRDFRDILCTYFKRVDLPITKESIDFIVNKLGQTSFKDLYKVSDTWTNREDILWMRYEEFFNNFDYVYSRIEQFFDVELTSEQKEYGREHYSLEANLERTRKADSLCNRSGSQGWLDKNWTQYTVDGINGLHITGEGCVGKWRHTIPEHLHEYVNEVLKEPLQKYDYK
jgi:hypothetical protein